MTGYIVRRILWFIPLLWAVATITFFLMHAVEGGPFDREKELPAATKANLEKKYNLDEPLLVQYGLYLGGLVQGDLGTSFRPAAPDVNEVIRDGFKVSLQLGVLAFVFAIVLGMGLGTLSAIYHNTWLDYAGVFFATAGAALPSFILATFLVVIFSVELGWTDTLGFELFNPRKAILPALSLGVLPAAFIARVTRASMLEVLNQDYIRTARAKGLREYNVVIRHAIKNAMIPVLTIAGPTFAFLITGSFVVEKIFEIPGIGRRFVDAVLIRDYGMIMGTTIFFAAIIATANLVVDLLYVYVDPRIRY